MRMPVFLATLLMAGCATENSIQQPMAPSMASQASAEHDRVDTLCRKLYADTALDPLRQKIGIVSDADTTFEMMTSTDRATDIEKVAIIAFANKKSQCSKESIGSLRRFGVDQQRITLEESAVLRFQILLADLHNGAITYGEFARKRKELLADVKTRKDELMRLQAQRTDEARMRAAQLAVESRKAAVMEQQTTDQMYQNMIRQPQTSPQIWCTTSGNIMMCQ